MAKQQMTQNLSYGQGSERQLLPGTVLIDRYAIQDVIGQGGMGAVYRATDLHFPNVIKLVAVKEMINQATDPVMRQTIVQNFEREANILVTLSHPAIPKIFDYFTYEERSYLVEEYVNGKDLEAILAETPGFLSEDQVIAWAIELCDVLHYLHSHKPEPIIFRDMKPSNVMINQQGHVVLVDFGIAKVFKTGEKGTMVGTEGYSPPEQYRGEATPLADIYALGATLHHLLTRKDPRLEAPFTFAERPIRQINPAVSSELEAVINTALKYNPEERYPSALAMKEALVNVGKKTGAINRIPIRTGPFSTEQKIKPLWSFKCEDEIRGSPICEGGIVYIGSYDHNLYAVEMKSGQFIWKFPAEGGITGRPVIYDHVIYFGAEDHGLYAVSARTGKLTWTYFTEGPIYSSPRLVENHVFIGSDDGYLHAVNTLTSRMTWRSDAGAAIRSTPCIESDLIYFGSENGEVICLDLSGETRWRFRAKRAVTASPLCSQAAVYVPALDSVFYALDAKSGWVLWRFRMGKGSVSSPCIVDNLLFFGSADEHIYCIDSGNAREIWRFKTEHQVSGSPIIYKDSLYCGSADGNLYCLEYRTGRLRWKFKTGGPITGTPYIYNDILFIGSADHILYALLA